MQFDFREPAFKVPKILQLDWTNWKGGLNNLLRQTEIKDNELAQADNMQLVGLGVPTKRPGSADYFLTAPSVATGSQRVRGLKGVLFASGASGVNELLAISDWGLLVRKNGASYTPILGASFSSGANAEMSQLYNNVYIVNGKDTLKKYNGASIYNYTQISRPTGLTATNLSGVSGTFTRAFRVSGFNSVGETIASDEVLVQNTPQDLINTTIRLRWTTSSPASAVVGYGIYGVDSGDNRYITSIDASSLQYDYQGVPDPSQLITAPADDTTSGPVAKYIIPFKGDKIILGNLVGQPSTIAWSGGGANVDKFSYKYGGGFVDIDKDSGDFITGLIEFQDQVIVFKQRSIWSVTFSVSGDIVIPTLKVLMRGIGAVSHRTIKYVENDVFFLTRRGVYTLGNEPNFLNVLRTNEVSSRVRPLFETLTPSQLEQACAIYQGNKYRLAFPSTSLNMNTKEIIYDRERLAWMGPNTYPATPAVYEVYYDSSNTERLVWGDANDNMVTDFSSAYSNDKGVKIQTILLTKKTAFDNPFRFKQVKNLYSNWRNVAGTPFVNIILETREGAVGSAQSFSIDASNSGVGWGFDKWGTFKWGTTAGAGSSQGSNDLAKRTRINKIGRTVQVEVTTSGNNDRYELLAMQLQAQELGEGIIPSSWNSS